MTFKVSTATLHQDLASLGMNDSNPPQRKKQRSSKSVPDADPDPEAVAAPQHSVFTPQGFMDLPTELRLMIWKHSLPSSQILHILYETKPGRQRWTQSSGNRDIGQWAFVGGGDASHIDTCREAQRVACDAGWEQLTLHKEKGEAVERRWFNFKTDTLFLNTNAYRFESVFGPRFFPVHGNLEKLEFVAIRIGLWSGWPFSPWVRTCGRCELCPETYDMDTHRTWTDYVIAFPSVKELSLVYKATWTAETVAFEGIDDRTNTRNEIMHQYRYHPNGPPRIRFVTTREVDAEVGTEANSEVDSGVDSEMDSEEDSDGGADYNRS